MRKLLVVSVMAIAFTALAGASPAAAAASLNLTVCADDGGAARAPAGAVVAEIAWLDSSRSLVRRFVRRQTTTASVDGVPVVGASDLWGPPTALGDLWMTTWSRDLGVLAPGDTTVVSLEIELVKKLRAGDKVFYGPGSVTEGTLTCAVTAV